MVINNQFLLLFLSSLIFLQFHANHGFDVRQHLCTVTRYDASKGLANNGLAPSNIPDGCTPLHLNLVARHGTRSPTKKRMEELDRLASHLEVLVNDAKQEAESGNLSLEKIPAWLHGWQSPWKGKQNGGDLISEGKNELYHLGIRVRERFKDLFNQDYHPDVYTIKSTQVPRVLASAEAFSMGLFGENRNLGPLHLASSGTTEGHKSDILLRFFDHCETYKQYKKKKEPALAKLKEPTLDKITSSFVSRYHLNFTRQDVASLWFLCKQEASLMDITDQACGLFTPSEVSLMEWTDDLEVFLLKGYGNTINYRMGVTLLKDVLESMDQAIRTKEGTSEKARLRFAHAETVVPFSCMLGLFLEGDDLEKLNREEPLELPPKPPQKRNWRGTLMTPFAGNNMLVLYDCPANNESKYYVQVLHNEVPVPLPGCSNSSFCPFDTFKEKVAKPHLVHNYNTLCDAKLEVEPVLGTSKSAF